MRIEGRAHFYRPVIELYFPAVMSACGQTASCYHWFSVALHFLTSLTVGALAASLSRERLLGVLAGLLFAMQPAGVEAVVWVSAVTELLSTLFFVLTVWLFWRALESGRRRDFFSAGCTFTACLFSHESGVMLLPILGLLTVTVPTSSPRASVIARLRAHRVVFVGFALILAVFGVIAYAINVRNYVVVEGQYALGLHMVGNISRALGTFVVARRDALGSVIVVLFFLWAGTLTGPRARFYALWTIAALLPFAGFRGGLSSRYLYLAAAGCAGLIAETLWWARARLASTVPAATLLWAILSLGLLVRFGAFAAKNVQAWAASSAPYRTYLAQIHAEYPSPERGALLEIPAPPKDVPPQNVPAFVRWEYGDNTLNVVVK
ncbi:MAG TPA: glycosyltransferase family 39 protein [Vicinamibacterales bacterium]